MDLYRLRHTLGMYLTFNSEKRAEYLKKHHIFYKVGKNCSTMFRKIPLYPQLISLGDNVRIAAGVTLITHDGIHRVINKMNKGYSLEEYIGCIEIKDNCFIGSNTTILPNVSIGANTIIAAGSLVNKSLRGNGVYAGVPAKYICSFDDFLKKRAMYPNVQLISSRKGLSKKTIDECWNRFQSENSNKT